MKPQTKYLKSLGACDSGIRYAARFPTLQDAWDACDNLADMKWLLKAAYEAAYEAACDAYRAARAAYDAACDAHPATYDAARAARATYRAAIAPHLAAYEAACAPIDACNTCDELRSKFSCPAVPV